MNIFDTPHPFKCHFNVAHLLIKNISDKVSYYLDTLSLLLCFSGLGREAAVIHQLGWTSWWSWPGFASSDARTGEVVLDSLAQVGELAKFSCIR